MIRFNFHHLHNFFRHRQFTSSASTFFVRFCSSSSTNNFNINDGNQHDEFLEPDFSLMQSIPRADAFAKPRLVNFLNRFHQPLGSYSTTPVEGGGSWYRCETRIPIFLPSSSPSSPERVATAVGFGKTEKEAENACAMHAERILDAAGAELFSLGAMQARHAEAAIKEGRWAQFPKNHPKRVQQDEEAISQGKSHSTLPPPLISMVTAEGKIHVPIQTKNEISPSSSMNKTTIVEEIPNQQAQEEEKSATATTTTSRLQHHHHLSTYYSRSLFSNDKTKVDSPGDIIEITIDDTKFTDDSEAQHEGIEIDQAEHCDWRIFPRVSQNKAVPPAFKHMDESEGGTYWLVEFGMYYQCESHSLLSPHLFCADSLERVRQYFSRHDTAKREFDDCVLQTKLGYTPWAGQRTTLIKVSVEIPGLEDPYQIVQAVGVSKDFDRALHLCAMHAELMIDHLGLILFPDEPELQEKHADFCASMGRWAASEEGEVVAPGKANPRPKPLREWGESVAVHAPKNSEENFASAGRKVGRGSLQARRVAPLSEEEFYMHCHHCMIAPNRGHTIEGNPFGENNSNNNYNEIAWDYVEILRDFNKQLDMQRESFYLNLDYSGVYRCTTLLPLDIKTYGLRCGYAIGNTPQEAKILCAWHAIEVLTHFGVPVFPKDAVKQKQFEDQRRRQGRFVVDRDKSNENEPLNAPSAKSRSPPSLRIAGPSRPLIRHDDWRAAQMIDASVFTVVDVTESKFDRDLIITAFENYCRNVFDSEHEEKLWKISSKNNSTNTNEQKQQIQQCIFPSPSTAKMPSGIPHISFYWGLQPVLGRFAVQANTAFAAVPLPRGHPARDALGGAASFLAAGRATDQKNAVKCFYLHAVRCLDSLGLLEDYCLKLNQYGDGNASFGEGSFASPSPAMHQRIEKEVETVTQQPEPKSPTKKAKGPKIIVLQAKTAILPANNNNNSNTAEPVEKIQPEVTKPLLNSASIPKSKVKAQPILDIEKLRKALSSVTAVVVQDHRDPSKFFSWGTPDGSKCSALRLFDDNGRPVNAAVINEQKRMQNIIVQQLPVPVMNTVVANICNERRTSKRWRMENQQRENEQAGGAQKPNVNTVF